AISCLLSLNTSFPALSRGKFDAARRRGLVLSGGQYRESGNGPTLRRRQAKLAQSVGESPTQVMLSRQPGSEWCASRRRRRPRSVHSGCVGCVIEPRNGYVAGAETVQRVERNMDRAAKRGHARLPGSKSRSRAKGSRRNLGDPAFGQSNSATGPHREGRTESR